MHRFLLHTVKVIVLINGRGNVSAENDVTVNMTSDLSNMKNKVFTLLAHPSRHKDTVIFTDHTEILVIL